MQRDLTPVSDLAAARKARDRRRYANLVMEAWGRVGSDGITPAADQRFARFDQINTVRRKARDTL